MKRFTFKGVLENFRQSVSQPTKSEQPDLIETLKSEHCQLARVSIQSSVLSIFKNFYSSSRLYSLRLWVWSNSFRVSLFSRWEYILLSVRRWAQPAGNGGWIIDETQQRESAPPSQPEQEEEKWGEPPRSRRIRSTELCPHYNRAHFQQETLRWMYWLILINISYVLLAFTITLPL